jgi:predicted PurR-regulated permease PerM
MPDNDSQPKSRLPGTVPWRTLFKIIAAVALVWLWLQIYQLVLVMVVAVLLAVTLDPVVQWVERRGLSRAAATAVLGTGILVVTIGFFWLSWSQLAAQAKYLGEHVNDFDTIVLDRLPAWMRDALGGLNGGDVQSYLASVAGQVGRSALTALTLVVLGFVLMLYLLMEAESTRDWLLAFVPRAHRPRAELTLSECRSVTFAYVAGNAITSLIAFVCTLVALTLLKVPAALLLALIAGLTDFVPVVGFIVGAVPTLLLALTVSTSTALIVAAFYIGYNAIESYILSPWAYGDRLKLSNVAIILAFAIGAQIAGVIGALIALPVAAIYPSIERIWLREQLADDTVRKHRTIEQKAG